MSIFVLERNTPIQRTAGIVACVGYISLWFMLTHIPIDGIKANYAHLPYKEFLFDKLIHAIAYTIMFLLVGVEWLWNHSRGDGILSNENLLKRICVLGIFIACFGIVDELTQPAFGREFDIYDWVADLIGISCGEVILLLAYLKFKTHQL